MRVLLRTAIVLIAVTTLVLAAGDLFWDWSWATRWVTAGLLLTLASWVLLWDAERKERAAKPGGPAAGRP